jgi:hypothetical protein
MHTTFDFRRTRLMVAAAQYDIYSLSIHDNIYMWYPPGEQSIRDFVLASRMYSFARAGVRLSAHQLILKKYDTYYGWIDIKTMDIEMLDNLKTDLAVRNSESGQLALVWLTKTMTTNTSSSCCGARSPLSQSQPLTSWCGSIEICSADHANFILRIEKPRKKGAKRKILTL